MIPAALPDLLEVVLTLPFSGDGIEANRSMVTEACALPDADREQLAGAVIDLLGRGVLGSENQRARARILLKRLAATWPDGSAQRELFVEVTAKSTAEDQAKRDASHERPLEWTCHAIPARTGKPCGYENADGGARHNGIWCCASCGSTKFASDAREEKARVEAQLRKRDAS